MWKTIIDFWNNLRFIFKFAFFLFIAIAIFMIFSFIYPILHFPESGCYVVICPNHPKNISEVNFFYHDKYENEIFRKGNEKINTELKIINEKSDEISKLDEIYYWELDGWLNPQFDDPESWSCFDDACVYKIFKSDVNKTRADPKFHFLIIGPKSPNETRYFDDPYWITYNKVGSCHELANLFSFMANQANFTTRTVNSFPADHRRPEIKIDGEWYYYDPWYAKFVFHNDQNLKYKWFNKTETFRENCNEWSLLSF